MSLKYLFVAEFADGSSVLQDQQDKSSLDPTKSQFYDVLNNPSELVRFWLYGDGRVLSLELSSGEFRLNYVPFTVHDSSRPEPTERRRLIYFRRTTVHVRRTTVHLSADLVPFDNEVEYHLGWQSTIDGENVQHTVVVR